jgi:hypothetical protein
MGEWRYSSTFLDLSTGWRWVVSYTPLLLYPWGKSPRYPLDRRLGGPQNQSGRCGEEKSCTVGNWTRTIQPVAHRYTDSHPQAWQDNMWTQLQDSAVLFLEALKLPPPIQMSPLSTDSLVSCISLQNVKKVLYIFYRDRITPTSLFTVSLKAPLRAKPSAWLKLPHWLEVLKCVSLHSFTVLAFQIPTVSMVFRPSSGMWCCVVEVYYFLEEHNCLVFRVEK